MENENITPSEPQNPAPQGTPTPAIGTNSESPLVGAIIVIAILAFGGYYYWGTQTQPQIAYENPQPSLHTQQGAVDNTATLQQSAVASDTAALDKLKSQSSSDEVTSIDADLKATDLNSLDKELQSI